MIRASWLVAAALLVAAFPRAPGSAGPCPDPTGAARLLCGLRLDLNREPAADLEALPGIGPARARALVAARPFASLEDVTRVPGIGTAILERLRSQAEVRP